MRMEARRQRRGTQPTAKNHWSGEDTEERAKSGRVTEAREAGALGARHEALPHTPPGGEPPETPAPFPRDGMVREGGNLSRVRKPRKISAPLTDFLPPEDELGYGKGGLWVSSAVVSLPLVGSEISKFRAEHKNHLTEAGLLMEAATVRERPPSLLLLEEIAASAEGENVARPVRRSFELLA